MTSPPAGTDDSRGKDALAVRFFTNVTHDICYKDLQSAGNEVTWAELYDHLLKLLAKYHNQRSRPAEASLIALKVFYDGSMPDKSIIQSLERNLCPLDRMEDRIKRTFR